MAAVAIVVAAAEAVVAKTVAVVAKIPAKVGVNLPAPADVKEDAIPLVPVLAILLA